MIEKANRLLVFLRNSTVAACERGEEASSDEIVLVFID